MLASLPKRPLRRRFAYVVAVLAKDESAGTEALADALVRVRERWEPKTTADNLRLIRKARAARGDTVTWADEAEEALRQRADG